MTADENVRSAREYWDQGNLATAELHCRQALVLEPTHGEAKLFLGLILHFAGRCAEAEEVFADLAVQEPNEPSHWINLGTARRGAKRHAEALLAFTRAAQLGADSADFYYNVGLTHFERLDFEAARTVLERAVERAPADLEIRYRYALACYEATRTKMALAALEGWESLPEITSELAANVGELLMNLGESARAEVALAEASRDPNLPPQAAVTIIHAYERMNRLSEARAMFERLAQDPRAREIGRDFLLIQAQLAERAGDYAGAAEIWRRMLSKVDDLHLRHYQLFPLAKCLDALRRYDEAFQVLAEAHRSQIAMLSLTDPTLSIRGVPTMNITQYGCDPVDVASWDNSAGPPVAESPIFIVAFPRSGTTLLELTLDAHPLLRSMDERPFVQNALDDLLSMGIRYPEELGRASNTQLDQVRAGYWERVARRVRLDPGQRLVDKNPLNILRLPLIRRLFPNARVVLAVRHPCDVLLSCYMQHFRAPDFALLCADLGTLAAGYRRTMDFWYSQAELLQPPVREVRYETLVSNFEGEIRALSDFLELPWDDALLAPASHASAKGFISTPSYSQVVQPVNKKAVGRWRAYEQHLKSIAPQLQPYLDKWGYDT